MSNISCLREWHRYAKPSSKGFLASPSNSYPNSGYQTLTSEMGTTVDNSTSSFICYHFG